MSICLGACLIMKLCLKDVLLGKDLISFEQHIFSECDGSDRW